MNAKYHGEPCKNYCFFATTHIPCDPFDGREKVVLSTCVTFGNGIIYIYDPAADTVEQFEFPDMAAWALLYLPEYGKLLVGTSNQHGYVLSFDLKTRTWAEPLNCDRETYVWSFARGKDGLVYGSDYPMCRVQIYDPRTHTLTRTEKVGNDPQNMYARHVFAHPDGNILVGIGCSSYESYYYDVEKGTFKRFGGDGEQITTPVLHNIIRTDGQDGFYRFYDPDTLEQVDLPVSIKNPSLDGLTDPRVIARVEPLINKPYGHLVPGGIGETPIVLNDGTIFGVKGQDLFFIKDEAVRFTKLPCIPPSTEIFGIASDENGRIWFSTGLGQTIGYYEPSDGSFWNSSAVTAIGGEVYGITPYAGKIYMAAYSGGDHIVYDPNKEWDQYANVNPVTLQTARPEMIRPIARSILGPDNNVWVGWSGSYGNYGGGLTRIHTDTGEVDIRRNIIPLHSHCRLAASDTYVYSATNGETSGMRPREDEFYLLRHDMNMDVVWSEKFALGQLPNWIAVVGGKLFLSVGDVNEKCEYLRIYDEASMTLLSEERIGAYESFRDAWLNGITGLLKYDDRHVLLFVGKEVRLVDAQTLETVETQELPADVHNFTVAPDKTLWFPVGKKLYSLRFAR